MGRYLLFWYLDPQGKPLEPRERILDREFWGSFERDTGQMLGYIGSSLGPLKRIQYTSKSWNMDVRSFVLVVLLLWLGVGGGRLVPTY